MKIRTLTATLLCSAGLLTLGAPLYAQDDAPPSAGALAIAAPPSADAPPSSTPAAGPAASSADAPPTSEGATSAAPSAMNPAASPAVAPPSSAADAAPSSAPAAAPSASAAKPDAPAIDASTAGNPDDSNGIAATVNDESISDYELRQRIALFVATSGLQPSADDMKRIREQILGKMEDEKLQLQEAQKKRITVSPVEVDKSINNLLTQNNLTIDQLRGILTNAGASELALRSQITAQIAWQKTVQEEYSDRVNISQAQVDAEYQRYADGANKPHFQVSEIFLPVTNPDQDAKVLKDAQNIEAQIRAGAPFQVVAHQFSQNPAAAQGGAIGWVHEGQLASALNDVLVKMTPGTVSAPVRAAGGYYILQLTARQEPAGTKINQTPSAAAANPDGTLPLARLLLPLGNAPTQEIRDSAMNAAGQIKGNFQNCEQLKTIAQRLRGAVYMDLGNMHPSDLSPEIQKALAQTPPGSTTSPLVSDAGVEVIARCDKKVEVQTAYVMPTREQVEELLFDQQISALAQRYMRDLKRGANVEVR